MSKKRGWVSKVVGALIAIGLLVIGFTSFYWPAISGTGALQQRQYERAVSRLNSSLERGYMPNIIRREVLMNLGMAYRGLGKNELALQTFQALIKIKNDSLDARLFEIDTLGALDRWDEAMAKAKELQAMIPNYNWSQLRNAAALPASAIAASVFANLGHYQTYALRTEEAIQTYKSAESLNPKQADYLYGEALNDLLLGRVADAVQAIDKVQITRVYDVDSLMERAFQYDSAFAYDKSQVDYDNALKIDPRNGRIFRERGVSRSSNARYEEALKDFQEAINLAPDDAAAYKVRGMAYYEMGRYADAQRDLSKAIEMDSTQTYAKIWLHLATKRLGSTDRADMRAAATEQKTGSWPAPIFSYFANDMDEASVIQAAQKAVSPLDARAQTCEANFYIGESKLIENSIKSGLEHMREVKEHCVPGYVELYAALHILKQHHTN